MKNSYYLIAILSLFVISCSPDDESSEQNNLLKISEKLNSLDTSVINQDDDSEMFHKSKDNNKKASKAVEENCEYTIIETYTYDGISSTFTTSYFDENMEPITNCVVENLEPNFEYYSKEDQITIGPDFKYTINSDGAYIGEITETQIEETSYYYLSFSSNLMLLGELNFDGDIFNIVEGSYIHMNFTLPYSLIKHKENNENFNNSLNLKYKFEFDANSQTYHFDMILDGGDFNEEMISEELEISLEYPLYDASNTQIGTIKYVQNFETGKEKFILYDLGGNLVE